MKEGTSIETHLKETKKITDKLVSIGANIVEEDQVVTLLGSLPPTYVFSCNSLGGSCG